MNPNRPTRRCAKPSLLKCAIAGVGLSLTASLVLPVAVPAARAETHADGHSAAHASPVPAAVKFVCPVKSPALRASSVSLPTNPDAVRLCLYSNGGPSKNRPSGGVVLGSWPARALTNLIADSPTVPNPPSSCTNHVVDVLMEFEYPSALTAGVMAVTGNCPETLVFVGGQARLIDKPLAEYLTGAAGSYGISGRRSPDLYGQPVAVAERNAKHAGFSINFAGEEIDAQVSPGVVLLQSPPPGAGVIGSEIDLVMSTRNAPACRTGQLALNYYGGGPGAGNDFGTILIRDTSAAPCLLQGPIKVVGANATNKSVTRSLSYPVARALVLSPGAARVSVGEAPPTGEVVAELVLSAEYRDGPFPPSYLCTQHYVIPATWRITFPNGTATVRNASHDPGDPSFSSLVTCQGEMNTPGVVTAE